ncbi:FAD-binding protein [Isoptericola sp. NEAU-Y5]|uniref:FAD-binding protein n=1 Tax=Isoptericola luteus TaxID=2879484 RepID=A0ABS7ZEQ8_9MICO|nr:FAD-binding protein [Isoptericola sp. NEAU-Y5]MCA5892235.1 FAD-binding protein [Isoptericola sp. NEAU-Y5]
MSITRSERQRVAGPVAGAGIDVTGLGETFVPGDEGFAEASGTLFPAGTPDVVVRPRDEGEVAGAVRAAARAGAALSVRSGGHGLLGHGADGGMMLDLRHLDSVEVVDRTPSRHRVVRVGAGATWGRVAAALAPHGLGITAGDTASVGVGGLTLGGGVGWMVRRHGLTVDSLVGARVVTADGRTVVANADRHAGLFWALRGGGGNFGVVVSLDLVAQRVTDVRFGSLSYAPDDVAGLVRGWRDVMRDADDELSSTLVLAPAMAGRPAAVTVLVCAAHDDPAAADRSIAPLLGLGTLTGSTVATVPYADVLADGGHPPGVRVVARNVLVPGLTDAVVDDLVAASADATAPAAVSVRALGGAFSRVPADATAFAHRDAEVLVVGGALVAADASDAEADAALAGWRRVAAHGTGVYANFQGSATGADLRAAYPPATLDRLRAVKRAYDPHNLFDRNLNVAPGERDAASTAGAASAAPGLPDGAHR